MTDLRFSLFFQCKLLVYKIVHSKSFSSQMYNTSFVSIIRYFAFGETVSPARFFSITTFFGSRTGILSFAKEETATTRKRIAERRSGCEEGEKSKIDLFSSAGKIGLQTTTSFAATPFFQSSSLKS